MADHEINLNIPLLRAIQAKIKEEPGMFTMSAWHMSAYRGCLGEVYHCGTAHCIGGWAQVLSGATVSNIGVERAAMEALGLTREQANRLFYNVDWPEPFHLEYEMAKGHAERADVAIRRIEHLINTGE